MISPIAIASHLDLPTIEPTKIEFPNLLGAPAQAAPAPSPQAESRGLGFLMGGPLVLPPHWLMAR